MDKSNRAEMSNENKNKQMQPPPYLLTIHQNLTVYRPVDGTSRTMFIRILARKYVIASTHGWLVIVDQYYRSCHLWKPGSKDRIKLPRLQDFHYYRKCVLSKPPTEPDCYILFISDDLLWQAFCKIGDVEFACPTQEKEVDRLIAIASFQGKIYGVMSPDYKFVTIEFVGRTMEFRPILINGEEPLKAPAIKRNWIVRHENDLIHSHSGNELLLVIKNFTQGSIKDGSEIRVFRVDINRMECIEVDDLGDQVILIGQYGPGFCCSSRGTTFKPNSIYYIMEFDSCVYVYHLDDKSTTSWLPHDLRLNDISHFWVDLNLEKLCCKSR
ncbi:hypothetical protein CASFOL_016249 [Castilleja foliolosa]|uniref:KIB1-4 beta-propeller domain-containing protein n=1 Tax=Castilleja foliolosa TaxID=1961234 RepID=A0ABD3DI19_9LAMI